LRGQRIFPYLRRVLRLAPLVGLLAMLGVACKFTPPTPVAYVTHGPAFGHDANPIAALPVRCGAAALGCLPGYQYAVASATRMALELGGVSLVDSELINAEMRLRTVRTRSSQHEYEAPSDQLGQPAQTTVSGSSESTTEVTGATWASLPPGEQRSLLEAIGVRGLLAATIFLGVPRGAAGQRTVTVRVAVTRLSDGALAWQSECGVETGDYHAEPQAVELATRCALESATLW
jgi:hypothetical protein